MANETVNDHQQHQKWLVDEPLDFIGFYLVLLGCTGVYCVLPCFSVLYCLLLGLTGFNWI